MSELEKCPFCGGEAHVYKNNLWHVACERAHNGCVTMSAFVTEAEAIAAWNTRAPVEYEGFFYLPKPKKDIVQYGEMRTEKTENGYKVQQPVEVIENAIRSWGDELGEYVMKRICEVWNTRHERMCRDTGESRLFRCSECGFGIEDAYLANEGAYGLELDFVRFCPSCGRKVVNP